MCIYAVGPWAGRLPSLSFIARRAEYTGTCIPLLLEVPKTEKSFEERLIFKAFLLKFVNSYTPIFYVAFFKGR